MAIAGMGLFSIIILEILIIWWDLLHPQSLIFSLPSNYFQPNFIFLIKFAKFAVLN